MNKKKILAPTWSESTTFALLASSTNRAIAKSVLVAFDSPGVTSCSVIL